MKPKILIGATKTEASWFNKLQGEFDLVLAPTRKDVRRKLSKDQSYRILLVYAWLTEDPTGRIEKDKDTVQKNINLVEELHKTYPDIPIVSMSGRDKTNDFRAAGASRATVYHDSDLTDIVLQLAQ